METYTRKTLDKVKRLSGEYRKFLYHKVSELPCEIAEIPAPENNPQACSRFQTKMPESGWRRIRAGEQWGGEV
ncbi:MAG: hypothetical protein IJT66_01385, partial [Clostridia bacterium]|nr:hypothetical protein [Clostridia bacterium]